jgi:hypothetical protein
MDSSYLWDSPKNPCFQPFQIFDIKVRPYELFITSTDEGKVGDGIALTIPLQAPTEGSDR